MNLAQKIMMERIKEIMEQGGTPRFLCCKSRQIGLPTLLDAFKLALSLKKPQTKALVIIGPDHDHETQKEKP